MRMKMHAAKLRISLPPLTIVQFPSEKHRPPALTPSPTPPSIIRLPKGAHCCSLRPVRKT